MLGKRQDFGQIQPVARPYLSTASLLEIKDWYMFKNDQSNRNAFDNFLVSSLPVTQAITFGSIFGIDGVLTAICRRRCGLERWVFSRTGEFFKIIRDFWIFV